MHLYTIESVISENKWKVLLFVALITAALIAADGYIFPDTPLGILYVIPVTVAALVVSRWQIVVLAVMYAILREHFGPDPWSRETAARLGMGLLAFVATGLLVLESTRSRRIHAESLQKVQAESALRRKAEEDARAVIESSPAAILAVGADGLIEMSNAAAKRMLRLGSSDGHRQEIGRYIPLLRDLAQSKRGLALAGTMVEGQGRRNDGEVFFAEMWVSAYENSGQTKLTAVIADISEQLRDREELGLRQLLMNSRIIAGAVSHEIRNLAAAADAIHDRISNKYELGRNPDYQALGALIDNMRKLAAAEVPASSEQVLAGIDLNALLQQLELIVTSNPQDVHLTFHWEIGDNLPRVRAEQSGLLQVLLNLIQNSRRAVAGNEDAHIWVAAYQLGEAAMLRVADNGPGVPTPELLFQPFQPGAASAGLGLYVSRAIVRTYGGELRYISRQGERGFLIELPVYAGGVQDDV